MHGSGLSLPKSNLRHHLKTCVATNFGWWTNGHLRLWGSAKYLCNMLCLPDCMFADDAAQSIIAFLTVVCRHTGGRYIAPEVSMHNTWATHKLFLTQQKVWSMKEYEMVQRGVNAQHKTRSTHECSATLSEHTQLFSATSVHNAFARHKRQTSN